MESAAEPLEDRFDSSRAGLFLAWEGLKMWELILGVGCGVGHTALPV